MFALLAALVACVTLGACSFGTSPVAIRDSLDDYSWEELSALSAEIAQADDENAALAIAERYHLAGADGVLDGTQAKAVELSDGTRTAAVIAGFNHDWQGDGSRAGITFMLADAVALRPMNNAAHTDSELADADAIGGWAASEMRRWLNGEFIDTLPADLREHLACVQTAAGGVPEFEVGGVDDQGTVDYAAGHLTEHGTDALWLPAVVELSGVSTQSKAAIERPGWTALLQAEGSQYSLLANANVQEEEANDLLVRHLAGSGDSCCWWLRSVEDGSFAYVDERGSVNREDSEDAEYPSGGESLGVVPCFALAGR
ncbi:MAG: DUF6273 domain-containing protein [Coriobacteriaceae bacterium]|nr:DUF6273 domain-containing protein [Coriobacteriaceae bacterium]